MSSKQPAHKRSGLGGNPLSQGLFSKTDDTTDTPPAESVAPQPKKSDKKTSSKVTNIESIKKNIENRFLDEIEDGSKESIGLQVTTEINDWLDDIVKIGRRKHGKKIPKQVWIQAGVELLRAMPVEWTEIGDLDELRAKLADISQGMNSQSNS